MMPMRLKKQQSGSALLLSLMTLALVSGITASLLSMVQEELSIAEKIQSTNVIQQQLLGGEAWAEYWLLNDDVSNNPLPLSRLLAHEELTTDYGELVIDITDLQSCININLLTNAIHRDITRQRLQVLSTSLGVDAGWIDVVTSWVEEQNKTLDQGKEGTHYLVKENHNLMGNVPTLSDMEWKLLDIPKGSIQRLAPYICALPDTSTAVNINRVPEVLIRAYLRSATDKQISDVINKISAREVVNIEDFLKDNGFQSVNLMKSDWQVDTRFVSVSIKLTMEGQHYWLHSQLSKNSENKVTPYYRSFAPIETLP
jgi:general secretion pathway protein K